MHLEIELKDFTVKKAYVPQHFYLLLTSLDSNTITCFGPLNFLDSFAAIEQPAVPPPTIRILQLVQQI